MILKLSNIIRDYNLNIRGIIHVGAYHGTDYTEYKECGINNILLFEPVKSNLDVLKTNVQIAPTVKIMPFALGNNDKQWQIIYKDDLEQNNNFLTSSVISQTNSEVVRVKKLDKVLFPHHKFNFLYIDVLGYELEILKGATSVLNYIDYIYTTVSLSEVYNNGVSSSVLDSFLTSLSYKQMDCNDSNVLWGESLYIRKKV